MSFGHVNVDKMRSLTDSLATLKLMDGDSACQQRDRQAGTPKQVTHNSRGLRPGGRASETGKSRKISALVKGGRDNALAVVSWVLWYWAPSVTVF